MVLQRGCRYVDKCRRKLTVSQTFRLPTGLKDDKQIDNIASDRSNNGLAQRNLNLESELDEQLSKLHDARRNTHAPWKARLKSGEIVSLEKFKALDFEKVVRRN